MNIERLYVEGDRYSIRKQVVNAFLEEKPGQGTGDKASKYRYNVEILEEASTIK